jgi:hypothetical protein
MAGELALLQMGRLFTSSLLAINHVHIIDNVVVILLLYAVHSTSLNDCLCLLSNSQLNTTGLP